MKINSIGGGPAGLYFSILMKKQDPSHDITVIERNKPYDTFGWGVVFSDETLGHFEDADKETYDEILKNFSYWGDIDTFIKGECVKSTGHGFAGLSRKKLLNIFQERAENLGIKLVFETEVDSLEPYKDADLILGVDGVNSFVRETYKKEFGTRMDWRKCKFSWLGTDYIFPAFTFIYEENEHGLFTVHAYPFDKNTSTFIVECREETWAKAGLDKASEEETVAYCEKLFAKHLYGHKLLSNKTVWRTFPAIYNDTWVHENIVLMGDAAHTAHFSIGSGTKLAMEDAIALADSFAEHGCKNVPATLKAYEDARWVDGAKLQKTAQTSLEWFENVKRYHDTQEPLQFTLNQTMRSKRITYDNLKLRDSEIIREGTDWFAQQNPFKDVVVPAPEYAQEVTKKLEHDALQKTAPVTAPPAFQPYKIRGMELANRIVVSPMCQYSCEDGTANDWTLVHLGSRGIGGAGLVYTEATHISPTGRITPGCAGMYKPEHVATWKRVTDFIHGYSKAKVCCQLAHSGRKGSSKLPWEGDGPLSEIEGAWERIAPSAIPYADDWPTPREMTRADMDEIRDQFVNSVKMADEAGFDMVELHYAHGYLLSTFISPLTNTRTDEYGGSLENRLKYPVEVLKACREAWPEEKPLAVRISATEWRPDGLNDDNRLAIARTLAEHGCDILDVSTGQMVNDQEPNYGRMFQTPFSDLIRNEAGVPTMTVGAVSTIDQANTILLCGRADLVMMARPHLRDPYMTLHAAEDYEHHLQYWPPQYLATKPRLPEA
ncbi:MAG: bifunctional salicylyl-CoA 5-hydroxylase/oxidoreductase [Planctomycetota bacterium]|jgi:anthraniloyl-CoA monooxygenase